MNIIQDQERQPIFQIEQSQPNLKDSLAVFKIMQKNKQLYDVGLPLEDDLTQDTFEAEYERAMFNVKYNAKKVHYLPNSEVQTVESLMVKKQEEMAKTTRDWSMIRGGWINTIG